MSEIVWEMQTPLAPTKPRPYVCVKCGRRVKVQLTDTAYRSPLMKYAPHDCAACGSPMIRASKHFKKRRAR